MLDVITVSRAQQILGEHFPGPGVPVKQSAGEALGKRLARPVYAAEFVPDYDRSMVDGYAVRAADTFGASDAVPALLTMTGSVEMGSIPEMTVGPGECCVLPTGGGLPEGADCAVMAEHTQILPDGMVCVFKPSPPGNHVIYRGDDVKTGQQVIPEGRCIGPREMGALSALGIREVWTWPEQKVGIISTGNELVEPYCALAPGKIRDINGPMLIAAAKMSGAKTVDYGIIPDERECLLEAVKRAAEECHMVILSGGTSVGELDGTEWALEKAGTLLWHGLAVKPGKPSLGAEVDGRPVLALPGHPLAAYFMWRLLAKPLLERLSGNPWSERSRLCRLAQRLPANDGRESLVLVALTGDSALPVHGKSGLVTTLVKADGYLRIGRDCEGLEAGEPVEVFLFDRRE